MSELGLEQANASQHLTVLRSKQIVISRKEGNQVFYSLRDPVLIEVLDILKRYFYSQLSQTMSMLKEIQKEKAPPGSDFRGRRAEDRDLRSGWFCAGM